MVTANGARFKDRNTIMNEQHQSYIDRYIRAKKRTEVTPKCLFGAPCRAETDRFLLQHELEQMKETREVYEKYDLSEIPEGDEKDNLFPEFERRDDKADEISVRFQPKVVTELDSPPSGSLFTPIEKVGSTGAVASGETKLTDYWQTSKRRRSSSNLESNSEQTEDDDSDSTNHPEEVE